MSSNLPAATNCDVIALSSTDGVGSPLGWLCTRTMLAARSAIASGMQRRIDSLGSRFALAAGALDAYSPLATLQRGYAIVTDAKGSVITDASRVKAGDRIRARLGTGAVDARVEHIEIPQNIDERPDEQ